MDAHPQILQILLSVVLVANKKDRNSGLSPTQLLNQCLEQPDARARVETHDDQAHRLIEQVCPQLSQPTNPARPAIRK